MNLLFQTAWWSAAALAGIWLGYPVIVGLLAALLRWLRGPTKSSPSSERPTVSVIIATRERDARVSDRVLDLLQSEYPPGCMEIVVAFDHRAGPVDQLPVLASERVHVINGDEPGGKAATLNAAVRAARGDVLVFTDTGQRFEPGAISALVAPLHDARVGAVSGLLDIPTSPRAIASPSEAYWLLERWLRQKEADLHSTVGVTGAIYALRRSAWSPLPAGLILDDVYTPMRVVLSGYRVAFARQARAVDARRFDSEQEYRRKVRTLTGVLQLCAWVPDILNPLRNPIWLQFVAHKLLRLLTPYLSIATAIGLGAALWVRARDAHPATLWILLTGAAVMLAWTGPRSRLRRLLGWSLVVHAACIVALANGLRGRWDVWR